MRTSANFIPPDLRRPGGIVRIGEPVPVESGLAQPLRLTVHGWIGCKSALHELTGVCFLPPGRWIEMEAREEVRRWMDGEETGKEKVERAPVVFPGGFPGGVESENGREHGDPGVAVRCRSFQELRAEGQERICFAVIDVEPRPTSFVPDLRPAEFFPPETGECRLNFSPSILQIGSRSAPEKGSWKENEFAGGGSEEFENSTTFHAGPFNQRVHLYRAWILAF